jgi:hypothetical protein
MNPPDPCINWRSAYNAAVNQLSNLESQLSAATVAQLTDQVNARNAELNAGGTPLISYTPSAVQSKIAYWTGRGNGAIAAFYSDWLMQFSLITSLNTQIFSAQANVAGLYAQGVDAGCIPPGS